MTANFLLGPLPPQEYEEQRDYVDQLYADFRRSMLDARIQWAPHNHQLSFRREPQVDGKHNIFWHVISGGSANDNERVLETQRCRRIHWLRSMIDEFNKKYPNETVTPIRWWISDQKRSPHDRFMISTPDFSYIAIIEDRPRYALLVTAYFVEHTRRRAKFQNECKEYWEKKRTK